MNNAITKPLYEWRNFEEIEKSIKKYEKKDGSIEITGCLDANKAHMIYGLGGDVSSRFIVVAGELKAREMLEQYRVYDEEALYFPPKDMLFYQADVRSSNLASERQAVLQALIESRVGGKKVTVITSFETFMNHLPNPEKILSSNIEIEEGKELELGDLTSSLASIGYSREYQVMLPGQFAVRGGIVDVYPLVAENPIRIEFFGDEVDSIREFDPESQRSLDGPRLERIVIGPASEMSLVTSGEEGSILDYVNKKDAVIFIDEPVRVVEHAKAVEQEYILSMEKRAMTNVRLDFDPEDMYNTELVLEWMQNIPCVTLCSFHRNVKGLKVGKSYALGVTSIGAYNGDLENLIKDLGKYKKNKYRCVIFSGSRTKAHRLVDEISERGINAYYSEDWSNDLVVGQVMVTHGNLKRGFDYHELGFVVISESDILGHENRRKKRQKRYENGQAIRSFGELKPGDYVVHVNFGVGIYRGIENIVVDGVAKDYMKIEYADNANLYVLVSKLDLILKYQNSDGDGETKPPKINHLGGQEWAKTKSKVKKAVEEVATDLVQLYAEREQAVGHAYSEDTVWQKEFEEMFPFEETGDQLDAIDATKADMESTKIMDRLVCGDVGFGKTEIAIRAAFKAVMEGKQVAYLCPTTILAGQHYNNFSQRMKNFPVTVDLMSRFKTPKEQRETIQNLKKGMVDIVIGTHRLLSKDVEYKDLGLLIIDEEQRFGVAHKEKIKQLKKNVDVLTLTATPIPRTLHMSMIGIRDMSLLEEAPQDRLPIQTYVMEYNEELVREAISRELAREGQVYFVHNRVESIAATAARIKELVPEAEVAFAHGKMGENELEDIMYAFINGEIDVLVTTTIIETGLDIPNVNTIIIENAERFGLSQLYQLRGRVGRSNRMAYAFFMYRRDRMLREEAEKRLAAIKEYTQLGSGYKIAMRDLEIRGAGTLLGKSQSGHMAAVGYDMYCRMLADAVKYLKGDGASEDGFDTQMDIKINAFIPDYYINNELMRLEIYKKISTIETKADLSDMQDELIDRFGDIPAPVSNLLDIAWCKAEAQRMRITKISQKEDTILANLDPNADVDPTKIPELITKMNGALILIPDSKAPGFLYKMNYRGRGKHRTIMESVEHLLEELRTIYIERAERKDEETV